MIQPKLKLVHPNAKNTGAYVDMSVRPASDQDTGALMVSFSPQKTVGSFGNGQRVMPTFDHEKKIVVKLNIFEVSLMVSVFDGFSESIDNGHGLFHRSAKGSTVVGLSHRVEPTSGYWFTVDRKPNDGDEQKIGIFLSSNEGRTLSIILKQAMVYMGFGIPERVMPMTENRENTEKKIV